MLAESGLALGITLRIMDRTTVSLGITETLLKQRRMQYRQEKKTSGIHHVFHYAVDIMYCGCKLKMVRHIDVEISI